MTLAVHDGDWLARPNASIDRRQRRLLFLCVAAGSLTIAGTFAAAGAWLVLPFAGLELLALAVALWHLERHADDFESVRVHDGQVSVEVRDGASCRREDCAACWMRFMLCRPPEAGATRLRFRAHGRELDVGRWMNEEQLATLAAELGRSIRPADFAPVTPIPPETDAKENP